MLRILIYRVVRHKSTHLNIFLCIVIFALLLYIHVSINSMQMNSNSELLEYHMVSELKYHKTHDRQEKLERILQDYAEKSTIATPSTKTSNTTGFLKKSSVKDLNRQGLKMGRVNSNAWYKICTVSMDSMRQHPLFPLWPSARGQPEMFDELESITTELLAFQRVYGYLYPPVSGNYKFKIISKTMSEFWLSSDNDPENVLLLARNNLNPLLSLIFRSGPLMTTSKPIYLNEGEVYYFEIQHSVNNVRHRGNVRVQWMLPGDTQYTGIPKTSVSTFVGGNDFLVRNVRELLTSSASLRLSESVLKQPLTSYEWENETFAEPLKAYSNYTRENFHTVEFADRWKIMSVFNECDYTPSYTRKRKYKLYEGVDFTHFTDVFPVDDTHDKQWVETTVRGGNRGNTVITEDEVIHIVGMFMTAIEDEFPGEYALANVINVERNTDKKLGNRFLLELILRELNTNKAQRVSEYLYRFHKIPDALCKPKGVRWIPNVKINAILTAKNQGGWVIHYIENMARIVHATRDKNVHFIVVDYGNNGVDIGAEFKRNNISQFAVIKKRGKFHKTLAIHEAVKFSQDKNSIIFLTDLHLAVPNNIFESVRKHTVEGKMTFTPVVFRLTRCSRPETESLPSNGFWETSGYGIFSSFKSDWNTFGGLNIKKFKYKWGGEDSEMVDRVLAKGLEVERLRLPHFYHFYHDRAGMWGR